MWNSSSMLRVHPSRTFNTGKKAENLTKSKRYHQTRTSQTTSAELQFYCCKIKVMSLQWANEASPADQEAITGADSTLNTVYAQT